MGRLAKITIWSGLACALTGVCPVAQAQPMYVVKDMMPGLGGSFPQNFVEIGGTLYYECATPGTGDEICTSDGTAQGTTLVKDIRPGSPSSAPGFFTEYNGFVYFQANDGTNGIELWRTDGTSGGTNLFVNIRPGAASSQPAQLLVMNGILYFTADDGATGAELWRSDGTGAGTFLVKDIRPGINTANIIQFEVMNNTLFFNAKTASTPTFGKLWKSDGTFPGTVEVSPTPDSPTQLEVVNNELFFSGTTGATGTELWKSDGTAAGTVLVKDINPGAASGLTTSLIYGIFDVGGVAYFRATEPTGGDEVWRSDGTDPGTVRAADINPGAAGSDPVFSAAGNGAFYTSANNGVTGDEPWKIDGSGATSLGDLNPGPAISGPLYWAFADGFGYFYARHPTLGHEPWRTDGTPGGTALLQDVYVGPNSSTDSTLCCLFQEIVAGASRIWFSLSSGTEGGELFALARTPSFVALSASPQEGSAGPNPVAATVFVYPPPPGLATVNYATADGSAVAPGDYGAASGTLSFPPGVTSQAISLTLVGDTTPELNEAFFVNLSGAAGAGIAQPQGQITIVNDDGPGLSVNDITTIESGVTQFFVTLSASSTDTITVAYSTSNGSATSGTDFTGVSGTLTYTPGQTFKSINVTITNDTQDEPNENFFLNLSNPTFAVLIDPQGEATIIDDDVMPSLSINNVSITEPATTGNMTFTVSLSALSGQAVTVDYATSDGTATAGSDYTATAGTLTIPAGSLTTTLPVSVIGDNLDELNETLNMTLTNPTNASINDGLGLGTINDNDTTNITIPNPAPVTEGDPPTNPTLNFIVTLSTPFYLPLTIDYATAPGTATADGDYVSTSGTLTFAVGTTTQAIPVTVISDDLDEPVTPETLFVNLSNNSGGNLTDAQGQGNITDDDTSQIQITSVSLLEGNSGLTPFVFDVTLSGPSVNQITVIYSTVGAAPNPATVNVDFQPSTGTLTFPAGSTSTAPVTVNVIGDTISEPDETIHVNLSGVTGGGTLPNPAFGVGTLQNDDTPGFIINDVTVTEGNAGTLNATFTVTLVGTFSGTPSVDFATADGTATAGTDYTTATGTLTFTAGVTTRTLVVPVVGETLDEGNETFFVDLTNPTGGVLINDPQGLGTITDNDTTSITIANLTVSEAVAGGSANFVVTFSVPNSQAVTLDYATADGTAMEPGDYTLAAGTLTVPAGTTTFGLPVPIIDDTLDEPAAAETFLVNLSNSSGPVITDPQATGSITDNDTSSLAVADISVTEGNTGTVDAVFTVSLGGGKTNDVTVNFATAPGTPNPATAGVDYTTTTGTLSFPACQVSPCPAGSLTQTVAVPVIGDLLPEADENFVLNLSAAVGATIGDPQGKCTIVDDDGLPSLSITDVFTIEPSAGTLNGVFTVTLAPTSTLTVNVSYATADGTATAPADYTAATGGLTFLSGQSTKSVTVPVKSDAVSEPIENYFVNLTNPVNADFSDDQGEGTIVDPTFSLTELVHGSGLQADLAALNASTPDQDRYRIQQPPRTSWEVLVDAVSGDVAPVLLERLSSTGSVLQTAVPAGDSSVSLRWENASANPVAEERVRVRTGTGGCGINCDAQDVYRVQAWDTTYHVSRYNNSASQTTILVIQNPSEDPVDGTAWFWKGSDGTLVGSQVFSIPPKGVFSLNTSTVSGVAATSGAITVTNDAPHGVLLGKAVAVETSTGFTFDTSLEARAR